MVELSRRQTLAWVARAGLVALAGQRIKAGEPSFGYGTDPDLLQPAAPWPLTLSAEQIAKVSRLADLMLPADPRSPAASAVGVPAFIDEWISAPYPQQSEDRRLLLLGLDWLDLQAGGRFTALSDRECGPILDRLCDPAAAGGALADAVHFFTRFRQICLTGYFSSEVGMADLGYVGNQPSDGFAGPPKEVLDRLRL